MVVGEILEENIRGGGKMFSSPCIILTKELYRVMTLK